MLHEAKAKSDVSPIHCGVRLLRRDPSGVLQPAFDVTPIGAPSPSPSFIVERLHVHSLDWQTRLLSDHHFHLFLNNATIDFNEGKRSAAIPVRTGQVGVCPRNEWHSISFSEPVSMLAVRLDHAVLSEVSVEIAKGMRFDPSLSPIMNDRRLTHLLFTLAEEQKRGYPMGDLLVDTIEVAIAKLLASCHGSLIADGSAGYKLGPVRLKRVKEFMHANLARKVNLKQLAACADLSTSFFSAQFRAETGLAPHQYLTKLRIDFAKQLLRETRASVLEVGMAAGFENQQHFATVFRRIAGVAPTAYRHMVCEGNRSSTHFEMGQHPRMT